MREFFRLKIVSKRQVTLPQLMLKMLHLDEGDEIEIEIEDGKIVAGNALKLVPTDFFTAPMLHKLSERSRAMDASGAATPTAEESGAVEVRVEEATVTPAAGEMPIDAGLAGGIEERENLTSGSSD